MEVGFGEPMDHSGADSGAPTPADTPPSAASMPFYLAPLSAAPPPPPPALAQTTADPAADLLGTLLLRREGARLLPATAVPLPPACRHRAQNLAYKLLLLRQGRSAPGAHGLNVRSLSAHLPPVATHYAPAGEPPVTIRKFSPCGRYLITFVAHPRRARARCLSLPPRRADPSGAAGGGFWVHPLIFMCVSR
jgi:hypothetical protein